jgi:hypothetical protein
LIPSPNSLKDEPWYCCSFLKPNTTDVYVCAAV